MTFINLSNHPSKFWGEQQREASLRYGDIKDYPFPAVDPYASKDDVIREAKQIVGSILEERPAAVMCQGEFTLTVAIVRLLQENGIKALSACTEHRDSETADEMVHTNGKPKFKFVQYREYPE